MRRRKIAYGIMTGSRLTPFVPAWAVVRRFSPPAAVAVPVVATVVPPVAAVVADRGADRRDGE